jgi:peptidoglycan/xylan/chitin deacetylase (PgdA/CDA1 family)
MMGRFYRGNALARRALVLIAFLVAALAAGAAGLMKVSKAQCFSLTGHAICRVDTDKRLVALTFDDGPTEAGLDAVLPLLKQYHATATFFLIGKMVRPQLIHRIMAAGHEIGNHSFHHRRMVFHSSSYYDEEIRSTDAALSAAGAPRPTLFRPPFGKKLVGLPLAVERSGKRMIMWDSGDPPDRDPRAYANKVLQKVSPGSIVLIHPMYEGNATERAALPLILAGLARGGYRLVSVSELMSAAAK